MMSAPVHRDDETDDFRLYAPPWVRERATTSDPDLRKNSSPALSVETEAVPPSASDGTERVVSNSQSATEAPADRHKRPAVSFPRMAPGVGGPNVKAPRAPPAPPDAARAQSAIKSSPSQTPEDEWPATLRGHPFEGDLDIKALRQRMSLDPEFVPAPPVRIRKRAVMPWL